MTNGAGGGGGGLGAGGDIFLQQGCLLTLEGGSLSDGSVAPGLGAGTSLTSEGTNGTSGGAFGSSIFFQGNQSIAFAPLAGKTLTVGDVIADQSRSGGTATNAGAGSVVVNGAGRVTLSGANTYTGGTTLESGTLVLASPDAAGSSPITFAPGADPVLEFAPGDVPTNPIVGFGLGDALAVEGETITGAVYTPGAGVSAYVLSMSCFGGIAAAARKCLFSKNNSRLKGLNWRARRDSNSQPPDP